MFARGSIHEVVTHSEIEMVSQVCGSAYGKNRAAFIKELAQLRYRLACGKLSQPLSILRWYAFWSRSFSRTLSRCNLSAFFRNSPRHKNDHVKFLNQISSVKRGRIDNFK